MLSIASDARFVGRLLGLAVTVELIACLARGRRSQMTNDGQFVEHSFDAGEVDITYAESGGSGTPLLLLHAATLDWHGFDEFLPTLSASWPIYACDLRGHGGSGWARSGYRIGDFADDISSFLANRVGQPAILIGYSLGASVAIQVAATLPRLVTAAILIEPGLALREVTFAEAVDAEIYDYVTWLYETIKSNPPTKQIMHRWLERPEAAGWTHHPTSRRHRPRPPHSRASIRDLSTTSSTTASTRASTSKRHCQRCPVRPSFSAANLSSAAMVRDSDLKLFESTVTNGTAILITGAGHGIDRDEPSEAVLRHIVSFLDTLTDARNPVASPVQQDHGPDVRS